MDVDIQGGIKARTQYCTWVLYVFLKQYCEVRDRAVGVARLVGGEHMGDAVCGRDCCC